MAYIIGCGRNDFVNPDGNHIEYVVDMDHKVMKLPRINLGRYPSSIIEIGSSSNIYPPVTEVLIGTERKILFLCEGSCGMAISFSHHGLNKEFFVQNSSWFVCRVSYFYVSQYTNSRITANM